MYFHVNNQTRVYENNTVCKQTAHTNRLKTKTEYLVSWRCEHADIIWHSCWKQWKYPCRWTSWENNTFVNYRGNLKIVDMWKTEIHDEWRSKKNVEIKQWLDIEQFVWQKSIAVFQKREEVIFFTLDCDISKHLELLIDVSRTKLCLIISTKVIDSISFTEAMKLF